MTRAYNKIVSKLEALDEYGDYLRDLQRVNKNSFYDDYHFYGSAERYLQLSIQALIDVAKLLIVMYQFPKPGDQQEAFHILFEKKVISQKLYGQLDGIAGFRNILVHDYQDIKKDKVYHYLQTNIDQFKEFKRQVLRFLGKKKR